MNVSFKDMQEHFSKLAPKYADLRTTDVKPILFIRDRLKGLSAIEGADIGSGPGRYDLKLFEALGGRLRLTCVDINESMIEELEKNLRRQSINNFRAVVGSAMDLPLQSRSMDAVFTFNAIHHFGLRDFLKEASRVLKERGYLFIYTRLRSQNQRSIWGRFFPGFYEKEKRLYELHELLNSIKDNPSLELESVECFKHKIRDSMERLLRQAVHRHYSTLRLYGEREFERAIEEFERNIRRNFKDPDDITWVAENTMLVARKRP